MLGSEELNKLVVSVADGDRQAFAILFNHFAPRVAAYLRRGGTSFATAEELAQEAMVVLWRQAGRFDPTRGTVSTWIFRVARNLRISRYRHEGAEPLSFQPGSGDPDLDNYGVCDPAPSPEERLSIFQREGRVRAAMKQLSPQQAHLVQLSFFVESPHTDIARDLRMPLGTVKSHIRRALITMRRLLESSES